MKVVQNVRMNTAQSGAYLGPAGQFIMDTGANCIRVMDGLVPGGFATLMAQNNLTDLPDKAAARNGLGLGSVSTHDFNEFDLAGDAAAALTAAEAFATAADIVVAANAATDATTKANNAITTSEAYADTKDALRLALAGGTMTGAITGADAGIWNANGIKAKAIAVGVGADISLSSAYFKSAIGTVFIEGSDNTLRRALLRFVNPDGEVGQLGEAKSVFALSSGAFGINATFSHMYYGSNSGYHIWGRQNAGYTEYMRLSPGGGFSVGTVDDAGATNVIIQGTLTVRNNTAVTGNISATGEITAFASDIRLKTKIQEIPDALHKVGMLRGVTYNWNEIGGELGFDTNKRFAGLIAQDINDVLPEAIREAPADKRYLTYQPEQIIPLLVEAIKELNHELRNQRQIINALQARK